MSDDSPVLVFWVLGHQQDGPDSSGDVDRPEAPVDGSVRSALSQVPDGHNGAVMILGQTSQSREHRADFVCPVHVHTGAEKALDRVHDHQARLHLDERLLEHVQVAEPYFVAFADRVSCSIQHVNTLNICFGAIETRAQGIAQAILGRHVKNRRGLSCPCGDSIYAWQRQAPGSCRAQSESEPRLAQARIALH